MTTYTDPKKFEREVNKALNKISDYMKDQKYVANVGVLGSSEKRTNETSIDNAGLGLVHEFGSVTRNIPPRSWLRFPILKRIKFIIRDIAKKKNEIEKSVNKRDPKELARFVGLSCEAQIQEAFSTRGFGTWRAKKPTLENKDKKSPLIMSGEFRQSITSEAVKK